MRTLTLLVALSAMTTLPTALAVDNVADALDRVKKETDCGEGVIPLVMCKVRETTAFLADAAEDVADEAERDVGIVVGAIKGPTCDILYGDPGSPDCPLNGRILDASVLAATLA